MTKRKKTHMCCRCRKRKKVSEFYKSALKTAWGAVYCKACKKEVRNEAGSTLEGFLKHLVTNRRYQTKREFNLTAEQAVYLFKKQGGKCALTGRAMTHVLGQGSVPTNISIDRINPSRGYSVRNVQLTCADINRLRGRRTIDELRSLCEMVLNQLTVK